MLLPWAALAAPDEIRLPLPEEARQDPGFHWVGRTQPLPETIAGEWSWTPDGRRVWRARLRASGARALRLRFESFSMPGEVLLYGEGRDETAAGPYGGGGPHRDGGFWSGLVPGEAVTVEYRPAEAVTAVDALPFQLQALARIDSPQLPLPSTPRNPSGPPPRAIAGCHLDASCFPEVEDRENPGVVLVYVTQGQGSYSCTGFLINPRFESDRTMLLLTAGHCIDTAEKARDAAFLWRYQTEECYGDPDWKRWKTRPVWTTGARLLVSRADDRYDFALLALDRNNLRGVGGLGQLGWWPRLPRIGQEVFTVGHPDGGYKRAAVGTVVPFRWRGLSSSGFGTVQWRLGTTEGGSSGSPLLARYEGQDYVVGVVAGNNTTPGRPDQNSPWGPSCDADLRTAFGRFDAIHDVIEDYLENEPDSGAPAESETVTVAVALGTTGESVTLWQSVSGAWWLGGKPVVSGTTEVQASNGYVYRLVLETDARGGMTWNAQFVPVRVTVRLGQSTYRIQLTQAEDGTWRHGSKEATEGMIVITPDSKRYRLSMASGVWVATEVSA